MTLGQSASDPSGVFFLQHEQKYLTLATKLNIKSVVQPYLHESRHQHAMKRARGTGGRFLNTKQQAEGPGGGSSDAQRNGGLFTKHEHSLPPGDRHYHPRGGG